MNSFRKLSEVAVISSAVTLVAVYIFVGSGGKLPGLNHGNKEPTNGSNVTATPVATETDPFGNPTAKTDGKPPLFTPNSIMSSSKVKVLDIGLKGSVEPSPTPQVAPAPNQASSPTIMLGPKSAPVFPTTVNQGYPSVPNPSPASSENPNDPQRKTIFHGSKSMALPPPGSNPVQQVHPATTGFQPASSSTPNVPAPQPYTQAPTNPLPQGSYYSGNRQPQPQPAQQQTVPQYKVQK